VLRRYPDAKRYGYVLLEVAARGRNSGPLAMPMVSSLRLPSELEGRLRAMSRAKTLGYRSTLCGAVVALVAVSAAFVAPVPSLSVDRGFADAVPVMTRPQRGPAIVDHAVGSAVNRTVDRVIDTVPRVTTEKPSARQRDSARTAAAAAVSAAQARVESTQVELERQRHELNVEKSRMHVLESQFAINDSQTYFEYQVGTPALLAPGSVPPIYPATLRSRRIEGEVDAEFVVDASGRVVPGSVKLTKSTNPLFSKSVLDALPRTRWVPAELRGVHVKQLVRLPFTFAMSH
jgi:TonB family protein